ncbi:MAG: hypothetical protein JXM72_01810 [Deltaproteobacteria bacterium]|nr:hypothetical protein [Deltaproteobacteria bacterium]
MNGDRQIGPKVSDTLGGQFRILIGNLIRGNEKKAQAIAQKAVNGTGDAGKAVAAQSLIEYMAQAQALKNAMINTPSIIPGVGTFFSFWLVGLEDFFLLDQSVKVILALCRLEGIPVERKHQALEDFIIQILGQTYGIADKGKESNTRSISNDFMIRMLPRKYANMMMNKGVHRVVRRILPFKRRSRLLPVGLGLAMSAYNAYDRIVAVGRLTLRNMGKFRQDVGMSDDPE